MNNPKMGVIDPPFLPGSYITSPTSGDEILQFIGRMYTFPCPAGLTSSTSEFGNYRATMRTYMVVQNDTASAVLPSIAYEFSTTAGEYRRRLGAIGSAEATEQYIVDDLLPAAGAPDGALLYVIIDGPGFYKTLGSNSARNLIDIGANIVGTANGRGILVDYVLTQEPLAKQIKNTLGRALSASTSDESSTLKLAYFGKY